MTKTIKKTVGQLYLERIEAAQREQRFNRNKASVSLDMTTEERAAINKTLAAHGRGPITNREILQQRLERKDQSEVMARAAFWRPIMPPANEQPFAGEIAAAEEAVRNEMYAKLSPAERHLFHLKSLQQQKLREQATAAEHAARMADPKVQEALGKLQELQRRTAFDPAWTYAETLQIEQAISQITTPGASLDEGLRMASAAQDIVTAKQQGVLAKLQAARAELDAQVAELQPEQPSTKAQAIDMYEGLDPAIGRWLRLSTTEQFALPKDQREAMKAEFDTAFAAWEAGQAKESAS